MAYSELIKKFDSVRNYMREFFVYGFKSREEFTQKSARSYDNERRRIESWLGDYMSFRKNDAGKNVFLSVDSRSVSRNPLYKAFKAKSFTDNDIVLHFYILDILADAAARTHREIVHKLELEYYYEFEDFEVPNESTIRKKLIEYAKLGILKTEKRGKELYYRRSEDTLNKNSWKDAVGFFSEAAPLGVIGSYMSEDAGAFSFKHHYILKALDSQIMYELLEAMNQKRCVQIAVFSKRRRDERSHTLYPMKIYVSTQTGRQYLLGYHYIFKKPMFVRLDNIHNVKAGAVEKKHRKYERYFEKFDQNLWGTSVGNDLSLESIEFTVAVGDGEDFIAERLMREKRRGTVTKLDGHTYKFCAEVYDAGEMLPWIRTFIGRITSLSCSNEFVTEQFREDLEAAVKLYGGDDDAFQ